MKLLAIFFALTAAPSCGLHGQDSGNVAPDVGPRKALKLRTVPYPWALYLVKSVPQAYYTKRLIPTGPLTLETRPLLTHRNLRTYHWNTHTLTLTSAARKRLQKHWPLLVGRIFVVTVAGKKLYAGRVFLSELSSPRRVPELLPTRLGLRIAEACSHYPTDLRRHTAVKKVLQLLRLLR